MELGEHGADLVAEDTLQRHRERVDEDHVGAELARRGGDLRTDPTGADHGDPAGGADRVAELVGILGCAEVADSVERRPWHGEVTGSGAGGQHGGGERKVFATVEANLAGTDVERLDGATGEQLDVVRPVVAIVVDPRRLGRGLAAQDGLGERRAFVRRRRFVADEHDTTVEPGRTGALGRLGASQAGTDDDETLIRGHRRRLFAAERAIVWSLTGCWRPEIDHRTAGADTQP